MTFFYQNTKSWERRFKTIWERFSHRLQQNDVVHQLLLP